MSSPAAPTLVIRPDSGRVELALTEASRRDGFVDAGAHRTFAQLVEACDGPGLVGRAPAEPWLVRALFAVHARACAGDAFGESAATPDFAVEADRVRGELFAADVSPSHLADVASQGDSRAARKARALAALFEAADARLDTLGLVDRRAITRLAARRLLERGLPDGLARFSAIEVRELHDLAPARLAFLDALAHASARAGLRFRLVLPWAGSPATDAFLGPAARFFEKRWEALPGVELVPETSPRELGVSLRQLFSAEVTPGSADGLQLVSCASPRDEARAIAAGVKRLLEAGHAPERLAVAFRDLAEDTEAVVEQLDAVGVPCRARLGLPLARSPIGRLARSLLSLADDDFPVDDVAALLESRYAPTLSAGLPPCRGAFAEAGVRDDALGARDGKGAFRLRLEALRERRAREAGERGTGERAVAELDALLGGLERVQALARSIPPRGPASALLDAWRRAVARLGVSQALAEAAPGHSGELVEAEIDHALARDQTSFDALTSVARSLELAFAASGLGSQELDRRTLGRWLHLAMAGANLGARGPRAGAVWLVDARELPGASFDAVFLGGLLDGRFPGRPPPPALLSDDERAELNAAASTTLFRVSVNDDGVALPLRLAEDRLLFHHALVAAPRVSLSFPRADTRGREALRSPFLDALERVLPGLPVTTRPHRPVALLDEVATAGELAVRAALELHSPLETRQSPRDARAAALQAVVGHEPWAVRAQEASAIEVERLRFFSTPGARPGRFSGAVGGEVLGRLLPSLDWGPARPVSASQLESWANCHFLGLGRRVLRLEEDEEAGEELDARALGELLHAALRRVIPALQAQGRWPPAKAQREAVAAELDAALTAAAAEVAAAMPIGHHLLFDLSVERARRELLRLLFDPAITPIVGAVPKDFERSFGRRDSEPALQQVAIPPALPGERPVHLVGSIDRLDTAPGQVAVIDYKLSRSGKSRARLDALLLKDFQLPLYLFVARRLHEGRAVDAAWVGLRKSEALVLSRVLKDADYTLDDVLAVDGPTRQALAARGTPNLANAVHGLSASLTQGDFGARPLECEYCHLRSVCRISARRLGETAEVE